MRNILTLFISLLTASQIAAACDTPTIGAEVTNISHEYRAEHQLPDFVAGALVRAVASGSRAATAGIRRGDVIQAIDRNLIQNACDFRTRIEKHGCGNVKLSIYRGGATDVATVQVISAVYDKPSDVQRACQGGDGAACTALAEERGQPLDLLRQACNLGDPEGCYVLGLKLTDAKEQAGVYEQSCDGGYSQACTNLGWMYENAHGVNKDSRAAVRLYRAGCDGNSCYLPNNLGCVNLGRMFRDGEGAEKNDAVATRLFRDVCRRNGRSDEDSETIARACSLAGTAYLQGTGVPKNIKEALPLLEKGCAAFDTFGCFNLGTIYENGTVVMKDIGRAIDYYNRACTHDDNEACERAAALKK